MKNTDYYTPWGEKLSPAHGHGEPSIGQEEFENLYGPLEEHMYFESPDNNYFGKGHGQNLQARLSILSVFKQRAEESFNVFLQKQKTGTILTKAELAAKKEAYLALSYVKGKIAETEARKGGKAYAAYR